MQLAAMALTTARPAFRTEWPSSERLAAVTASAAEGGRVRSQLRPEQELYVGEVRDAAMPDGVACPQCRGRAVVRHGKRRGIQRYKCKSCRRVFTDLTGTVLQGLHRPDLWLEFSRCLTEGLSVRASASRLGISKNTAFAWRHRALAALSAVDRNRTCKGVVEVMQCPILRSFKGSRVPPEARMDHLAPQVRRYYRVHAQLIPQSRLATMVVAVDRASRMRAAIIERGENLTPTLLTMSSADAEVCASRRYGLLRLRSDWPGRVIWLDGSWGRLVDRGRVARMPHYHLRNAYRLMSRFQEWLGRFLGVATKYLVRYFAWYMRYAALTTMQRDVAAKVLLLEVLRA
jgi:transposase-like protein